jgi:hypothetical protein
MRVITNDVSDYINLLVGIAHIICNQPVYLLVGFIVHLEGDVRGWNVDRRKPYP